MLLNPSFDPPYIALPKHGNILVAENWRAWWESGGLVWSEDFPFESGHPAKQPEFKPLSRAQFPQRVLKGECSQCWFTFQAVHFAGVCQYDVAVPQGRTVKFGAMMQAWCSNFEEPYKKSEGEMYARLLIRHGGGNRWKSGWSWHPQWVPLGVQWKSLEWEFVAEQPVVSVGIATWAKWPKKHNDVILSHAWLKVQGEPEPTPEPVPPPEPPSSDEILDAKIWLVKKQLAVAQDTEAFWQTVLVDLEQPGMLDSKRWELGKWIKGLVDGLREEKAETSLLGVRSKLDKDSDL